MTENVAPYALYGDLGGNYNGQEFIPGNYSLTASPYSERNLGGSLGVPLTVQFRIIDEETIRPFITTWKTDNPGTSNDNQITISTFPDESYDYNVDWGDGTTSYNLTGNVTKTYSTPGIYTVSISGEFPRIYFLGNDDSEKILSVDQWGDILWSSMELAFIDCINMDVLANDTPDLSQVSSMSKMFILCQSLVGNSSFNDWDVSNVSNMSRMFDQASIFNQNISNWNVSNVTDMGGMFIAAFEFNQPIGSWDVSSVLDMNRMFSGASLISTKFNQDISNWDVSNVTDMTAMFALASEFNQDIGNWNVGNVTNMNGMFSRAKAFNQNIGNWDVSQVMDFASMLQLTPNFNQDIGSWNVGSATRMTAMFQGATAFDQDLGSWDISNVTDMNYMFSGVTLSTENYDATLIGWNTLGPGEVQIPQDVVFTGGNSQFCLGEAARQNLIDTNDWIIIDMGMNCSEVNLSIIGFVLVDADTNLDIMPVVDGMVIDLSTLPTQNLNIRANATADVESVLFELMGEQPNIRTENVAPYALYGDNAEDYFGNTFVIGTYSLTATPFSGNNQRGNVGTPMSVSFKLVNNQTTNTFDLKLSPNPAVTEVTVSMENPDVAIRGVMIHDIQGRVLVNYSTGELSKGETYTLPIMEFPAGVYYMSVIDDTGIVGRKLLMVRK